ncbi:MAG: diaminopimelate decarboxylase [Elusimicrobia bacterium RIFCSPLOWO2_01_FULL_59_12]|nr:MAG: diaminopimelate decarboxylase [Elusimicrobia bacterium RIFCSPLOWO2_01_FULL_59_12]
MKTTLPPGCAYRRDRLWLEEVPLEEIVRDAGTPLYIYSRARILENYQRYDEGFAGLAHQVLYAVKANSNAALIALLARAGAGADIVSAGELHRARRAGVPAQKIVFSGVGKRPDEIRAALEAGILMFNVESIEELQAIDRAAAALHKAAPVAIRVNPDVDAMTHDHITTGKKENKFGIPISKALPVFHLAARLPRINLLGAHVHIGSQIMTTRPYVETLNRILKLADTLEDQGVTLRYLDLGGGLGVRYKNEEPATPKQLAKDIAKALRNRNITLLLEPGRYLVADAGLLATRVLYRKDVGSKHFIVVDAAMNDLARPALYDAYHAVFPLHAGKGKRITADIVGPVCESGDYLARQRVLPLPEQGDGLVVATAGAYGFVMGSQYNSRPRPAEVLVHGNRWTVIRDRETLDDLVRGEHIPSDW